MQEPRSLATADVASDPDAVYVCDPAIMSDLGAVVLRPGKQARRVESSAAARDFRALGVPVAFEMSEPATAEGGDTMWLDERTLLVGRSYRTNDAGIGALRDALAGVEVLAFDLPRLKGPDACLHLLSLLSPIDDDLVVAYVPLMPIRLLELLADRDIAIVEVPTTSSTRWVPTCSRWRHGWSSPWTATRIRHAAWSGRASTSPCTRARTSRTRARAGPRV